MMVKDSRTEEERGNAADLLKLVMVRKCLVHQSSYYCFNIKYFKTKYREK